MPSTATSAGSSLCRQLSDAIYLAVRSIGDLRIGSNEEVTRYSALGTEFRAGMRFLVGVE
jgi:hypothetical protein